MYYQFDSRLNMPSILFDDDRMVVGKKEYDYSDLRGIEIKKAPFLSTYGIIEMELIDGRKVPFPFVKSDHHRIRTAIQEVQHMLMTRHKTAGPDGTDPGSPVHAGAPGRERAGQETDRAGAGAGPREAVRAQAPLDPYEELKKLKELLDLEIVTQEEFDKKKKELLNL